MANQKHYIDGIPRLIWYSRQEIKLVTYPIFVDRVKDGWDPLKAVTTPNRVPSWRGGIERTPEDIAALKRLKALKKGERIIYARKKFDEKRPPAVTYDAQLLDFQGKIYAFTKVTATYKNINGVPCFQDVDYIAVGRESE